MSSADSLINTSCYYEERFQLTHVKSVFFINLSIFMQKWLKYLDFVCYKNNLINLFEEHQFHFRINHVLERCIASIGSKCSDSYNLLNMENDTSNQEQMGLKKQIQFQ